MLSASQEKRFSIKAKEAAKNLLEQLGITEISEDNIGVLQRELDSCVSALVTMQECEDQAIDVELLKIYDLLSDIVG